MKPKKPAIILVVILIVGLILLVWFLLNRKVKAPTDEFGEACLVFQGIDLSLPCYRLDIKIDEGVPVVDDSVGEKPTEPSLPQAISLCDSSIQIERDDCITSTAIRNKDQALCDYVVGLLTKTVCVRDAKIGKSADVVDTRIVQKNTNILFIPTVSQSLITAPIISSGISPVSAAEKIYQETLAKTKEALANPDPRLTASGYYQRLAATSTNVLFAIMPYEVKQGDIAKVHGQGFTRINNTLHIGNYEVPNLESVDASNMSFVVPQSIPNGIYEVWVTNSKGSTRNANQRIQLSVTSNPKPVPIITSITPSNPKMTDTVTLSGENLTNIYGVYTSLGEAGKSLTFKLSDLEFAKYGMGTEELAGVLVPIYVYVVTDVGFNTEPFIFNVQY